MPSTRYSRCGKQRSRHSCAIECYIRRRVYRRDATQFFPVPLLLGLQLSPPTLCDPVGPEREAKARACLLRDVAGFHVFTFVFCSVLATSSLCRRKKTVDLFEGKDIGLVVRCIFALGSAVQGTCPEYTGPTLGAKPHQVNEIRLELQGGGRRATTGASTFFRSYFF